MAMPGREESDLTLSVVVTVVSGKSALRRCLEALRQQIDWSEAEIIVPYDRRTLEVEDLLEDFPLVRFHYMDDLGLASSERVASREHRLYDRRRAVGLSLARGRLIAMTEDHAVPASDWCQRILEAHRQPFAAIGGAIDNHVDRPLNWALYYCDFGRYGSPLEAGQAEYVSDVNVSYKRSALEKINPVWREVYHETTVHWTLKSRGEAVFLDPRMVVHQQRPPISFRNAMKERIEWGRVFAETRAARCGLTARALYTVAAPALPVLLLARILRHMARQRRTLKQIATALPLALCLLVAWSLGEMIGYLAGEPRPVYEMTAHSAGRY
jgi:hypothetical protein